MDTSIYIYIAQTPQNELYNTTDLTIEIYLMNPKFKLTHHTIHETDNFESFAFDLLNIRMKTQVNNAKMFIYSFWKKKQTSPYIKHNI